MCVQTTYSVMFTNKLHVTQRQKLSLYATNYNTKKMNERTNEQKRGGEKRRNKNIMCVFCMVLSYFKSINTIRRGEKKLNWQLVKTKACIFRLVNVAKNLKCSWI